jgi:hypothetical protein
MFSFSFPFEFKAWMNRPLGLTMIHGGSCGCETTKYVSKNSYYSINWKSPLYAGLVGAEESRGGWASWAFQGLSRRTTTPH